MATFRQLHALIAVVDHGSFDAAAERLGVVQSAVSRQIHELEAWLGFALFDRTTRTATLTPQALPVLEQARRTLIQQELLSECLNSTQVVARSLRIGADLRKPFKRQGCYAGRLMRAWSSPLRRPRQSPCRDRPRHARARR